MTDHISRLKKANNKGGAKAVLSELDNLDYGPLTLAEIGDVLGITRERVRQIQESALKKLKHPSMGKDLKKYIQDYQEPTSKFYGKEQNTN